MSEGVTDKPIISIKELIYIVSIIAGFNSLYFALRSDMRDILADQKAKAEIIDYKFLAVNDHLTSLDDKQKTLSENLRTLYAIKPEEYNNSEKWKTTTTK